MTTTAVVVATGGIGSRAVDVDYPTEEGLTLGTTKRKDSPSLEPEVNLVMMGA